MVAAEVKDPLSESLEVPVLDRLKECLDVRRVRKWRCRLSQSLALAAVCVAKALEEAAHLDCPPSSSSLNAMSSCIDSEV